MDAHRAAVEDDHEMIFLARHSLVWYASVCKDPDAVLEERTPARGRALEWQADQEDPGSKIQVLRMPVLYWPADSERTNPY